MLASILKTAGYTVGTFTSPHLVHVRERIAINGNPILPDDFQFEVNALKTHLEALGWPRDEWPTYFECLNVIAYQYFKRKNVELTVFETGLGGRLDSTNVVRQPHLTVITSIGFDHMQHLGDTLAAIAGEKAGILKTGVPLVLGPNIPAEARAVILHQAEKVEAPVALAASDSLTIDPNSNPVEGLRVQNQATGQDYTLGLLGPYQKENLATVLAAVQQLRQQGYDILETHVQTGLLQTRWPVRFQYFENENLLLDGSHNADGFATLQAGLEFYFKHRAPIWVVSLRANRTLDALLQAMQALPKPLGLIVTQAEPAHLYHPPQVLAEAIQNALKPDYPVTIAKHLGHAYALLCKLQQQHAAQNPLGIVTGSLYSAGEILHALEQTCKTPLKSPL
jgi:dihydrofolate synthase/folylpolyglutamate synthase